MQWRGWMTHEDAGEARERGQKTSATIELGWGGWMSWNVSWSTTEEGIAGESCEKGGKQMLGRKL